MSLKHTFTCDRCDKKIEAKSNGEHFLPPPDWVELHDPITTKNINVHLCGKCYARAVDKETKEAF